MDLNSGWGGGQGSRRASTRGETARPPASRQAALRPQGCSSETAEKRQRKHNRRHERAGNAINKTRDTAFIIIVIVLIIVITIQSSPNAAVQGRSPTIRGDQGHLCRGQSIFAARYSPNTAVPPELWPKTVTRAGSPPKAAILSRTYSSSNNGNMGTWESIPL